MGGSKSKNKDGKKDKKRNTQTRSSTKGFSSNQTTTVSHQSTVTTHQSITRSHSSTGISSQVKGAFTLQPIQPSTSRLYNTISQSSNIVAPDGIVTNPPIWRPIASRPPIPYTGLGVRGPLAGSSSNYSGPTYNTRLRSMSTPSYPLTQLNSSNSNIDEQAVLKINVRKGTTLFTEKDSHVPMYPTTGRKRGMSLIINNINFEGIKPREGAEHDSKNLVNLFKALKLDPKLKHNLKSNEISKCIDGFASNSDLDKVDMCVIVIMSHGTGSMDTMTEICGIDNNTIKVYDIISRFSEDNCKRLKGKPKIFILQCCRGESTTLIQTDATPSRPAKCGDMLVAYSTMAGFVSYRSAALGSLYIREICKVFMEHAGDTHVEDMLKKVGENVKKNKCKQLTSYDNMSFNNCYLNPV